MAPKFTQKPCPTKVSIDQSGDKASHHSSGSRVVVVRANVAAPIIGQDNACQPSVQGNMGLGISGKHQQMGCIIPPANFFLLKKKTNSDISYVINTKQRPQNWQSQKAGQVVLDSDHSPGPWNIN